MSTKAESRLSAIKRFSGAAKRLCGMYMGAIGLWLAAWLSIIAFAPTSGSWGLNVGSASSIWSIGIGLGRVEPGDALYRRVSIDQIVSAESKILLGLVVLLYFAWLLKFTYHMFKLFGNYARGDIFAPDNIRQIRQIGVTTLLGFAAQFLPALFAYLLVQAGPQPGFPPVDVDVGFFWSFWAPYWGGVIIFVSWVMDVGREIRDENRELEAEQALVI